MPGNIGPLLIAAGRPLGQSQIVIVIDPQFAYYAYKL